MCNKVVVESSSLGYRRVALEEGFVEKYSQSFGDAERFAGVVHGIPTGLGLQIAEGAEKMQSKSTKQMQAWRENCRNGGL